MVSAIPHAALAPENAIDRTGHANGEALHAAREHRRRIRLHQQVEMIGLYAEVEEAEGMTRGRAKGALNCGEQRSSGVIPS